MSSRPGTRLQNPPDFLFTEVFPGEGAAKLRGALFELCFHVSSLLYDRAVCFVSIQMLLENFCLIVCVPTTLTDAPAGTQVAADECSAL